MKSEGEYFDASHYDKIIDYDYDIYMLKDGKKTLLNSGKMLYLKNYV